MLWLLAMILILVGMILIFLGLISAGGKVRGGGVILIGPIPIVFGDARFAIYAMIFALILILSLILLCI